MVCRRELRPRHTAVDAAANARTANQAGVHDVAPDIEVDRIGARSQHGVRDVSADGAAHAVEARERRVGDRARDRQFHGAAPSHGGAGHVSANRGADRVRRDTPGEVPGHDERGVFFGVDFRAGLDALGVEVHGAGRVDPGRALHRAPDRERDDAIGRVERAGEAAAGDYSRRQVVAFGQAVPLGRLQDRRRGDVPIEEPRATGRALQVDGARERAAEGDARVERPASAEDLEPRVAPGAARVVDENDAVGRRALDEQPAVGRAVVLGAQNHDRVELFANRDRRVRAKARREHDTEIVLTARHAVDEEAASLGEVPAHERLEREPDLVAPRGRRAAYREEIVGSDRVDAADHAVGRDPAEVDGINAVLRADLAGRDPTGRHQHRRPDGELEVGARAGDGDGSNIVAVVHDAAALIAKHGRAGRARDRHDHEVAGEVGEAAHGLVAADRERVDRKRDPRLEPVDREAGLPRATGAAGGGGGAAGETGNRHGERAPWWRGRGFPRRRSSTLPPRCRARKRPGGHNPNFTQPCRGGRASNRQGCRETSGNDAGSKID